MIARSLTSLGAGVSRLFFCISIAVCVAGCGNSDSEPQGAYSASGGLPNVQRERVTAPLGATTETVPASEGTLESTPLQDPEETLVADSNDASPGSAETGSPAAVEPPAGVTGGPDVPFKIAGMELDPAKQLTPDLTPSELNKLLSQADHQIQLIFSQQSGIESPQEARKTLIEIIKVKLEASRRLAANPDSTSEQQSEGARGELQSLSHLAALGDVKVAEELEQKASEYLGSEDPSLVSDSRLVLIGFALESLQNGDEKAPEKILEYFEQLRTGDSTPDVPSLLIMGQARQALMAYGHEQPAQKLREMIIELFAGSENPDIARMAADIAGNVEFDDVEKRRIAIMNGESVTPEQWRELVEKLIQASADMQTVQYLAGSALEMEGRGGIDALVDMTYQVLQDKFQDPESATGREVQLAAEAKQARKDVLGREFDPDLKKIDGSELPMKNFRGKVVLMPFWATGFPDSLQLVPQLKAIRDSHPDKVEIVGINLDPEGASVSDILRENDLGFPSLRAESSPTAEIANPVAASFGMVSLPFVAILDADGKVSALNFTGQNLEQTVNDLLQP